MDSNTYCKQLIEGSFKNGTIREDQRYAAHFEFSEIVERLNQIKEKQMQQQKQRQQTVKKTLSPYIATLRKSKSKQQLTSPKLTKQSTEKELIWSKSDKKFPKINSPIFKSDQKVDSGRLHRLKSLKSLRPHLLTQRIKPNFDPYLKLSKSKV